MIKQLMSIHPSMGIDIKYHKQRHRSRVLEILSNGEGRGDMGECRITGAWNIMILGVDACTEGGEREREFYERKQFDAWEPAVFKFMPPPSLLTSTLLPFLIIPRRIRCTVFVRFHSPPWFLQYFHPLYYPFFSSFVLSPLFIAPIVFL